MEKSLKLHLKWNKQEVGDELKRSSSEPTSPSDLDFTRK